VHIKEFKYSIPFLSSKLLPAKIVIVTFGLKQYAFPTTLDNKLTVTLDSDLQPYMPIEGVKNQILVDPKYVILNGKWYAGENGYTGNHVAKYNWITFGSPCSTIEDKVVIANILPIHKILVRRNRHTDIIQSGQVDNQLIVDQEHIKFTLGEYLVRFRDYEGQVKELDKQICIMDQTPPGDKDKLAQVVNKRFNLEKPDYLAIINETKLLIPQPKSVDKKQVETCS